LHLALRHATLRLDIGRVPWRMPRGAERVDTQKISYGAIGVAVAGIFGALGTFSEWWKYQVPGVSGWLGVTGISQQVGKIACVAGFACLLFGGAFILMSTSSLKKAFQALAAVGSVVLMGCCGFALFMQDTAVADATNGPVTATKLGFGLVVSALAGIVAFAAAMISATDKSGQTVLDQMEGR
jgi:hypothetical protein